MQSTLVKVLTNLGLTEKEAKVYLACLEQNSSPVSSIGSAAGINRVTTYDILEKLKKKGLVSYFTKQKVKYFNATKPEIVLEEFEKRTKDLKQSLPQLNRLTGETNHPRIQYFEGLEGIKAIYADTLTSKTEILNYSNSSEVRLIWPTYDKDYVEKRAKKGLYLRGIAPKDEYEGFITSDNKKYKREIRILDSSTFNFTNEINIYDDKVAIISFKDELIGMIIESQEIANSQRAIFEMCWKYTDLIKQADTMKNKMMERISGDELEKSIKNGAPQKPKLQTKEEIRKNLSLF